MIENNLLQSNFLGRDGFRWWIGQIPPAKTWALQWSIQPNAWGNRVKVRIMVYHPQNTSELKDEDLPWATVLLPATAGSGKGGKGKPGVHNARTARKSNLKKVTAAQHNKLHPEKGRKAAAARKRNNGRKKKKR